MNIKLIVKESKDSLKQAILHYLCLRQSFRASVWRDEKVETSVACAANAHQCCASA